MFWCQNNNNQNHKKTVFICTDSIRRCPGTTLRPKKSNKPCNAESLHPKDLYVVYMLVYCLGKNWKHIFSPVMQDQDALLRNSVFCWCLLMAQSKTVSQPTVLTLLFLSTERSDCGNNWYRSSGHQVWGTNETSDQRAWQKDKVKRGVTGNKSHKMEETVERAVSYFTI